MVAAAIRTVFAQPDATTAIVAATSFRLPAQPPPAFEVASIKPHQGPLSRIMDFK
jgi:hypothetical protein